MKHMKQRGTLVMTAKRKHNPAGPNDPGPIAEPRRVAKADAEVLDLLRHIDPLNLSFAADYIRKHPPSADAIAWLATCVYKIFMRNEACRRKQTAQAAANARHDQPGGSRDKQQQIREIWKTGKYTSRDICAEQECGALEMSFSTARKALKNIS